MDIFSIQSAVIGGSMLLVAGLLCACYFVMGKVAYCGLARLVSRYTPYKPSLKLESSSIATMVFGLLVYLSLVLISKIIGLPWWFISLLPFVVALIFWRFLFYELRFFKWRKLISIQGGMLALWSCVVIYLGLSLFVVNQSIKTPWMNNYGDLTFHLGMIQSFLSHVDGLPEYHLFAGEQLSYPFFVNLWTASLVWPFSSLDVIPYAFALQWIMLWLVIYKSLGGMKNPILPWLLLLGGGTYFGVMSYPDKYSWQTINEGFPWTTFLSTIWVTQRSALFGAAMSLVCFSLLFKTKTSDSDRSLLQGNALLAGLILGLSPLVHTYFFMFSALFFGSKLLLSATLSMYSKRVQAPVLSGWLRFLNSGGDRLILLVVASLVAIVFFPLLLGKSGMMEFMYGWTVPLAGQDQPEHLLASVSMWLKNAWQWLLVWAILWCVIGRSLDLFILALLFILGSFLKIAVWEWDQIKVFLVIYVLFLAVWSCQSHPTWNRLQYLLGIVLCFPGGYELYRIVEEQPMYEVYSKQRVAYAKGVRSVVPASAIIATASSHNAAATLTGRRMFMGYPGTLASHKINYQAREHLMKTLPKLLSCKTVLDHPAVCPDYLLWSDEERRLWKRVPTQGFERVDIPKTDVSQPTNRVYKIIYP